MGSRHSTRRAITSDVLTQHLEHLRAGEPILKPVYSHLDGTFGAPEYVQPAQFTIVEGLLGLHTPAMRDVYDVRVYLDPPEDLRRRWKVQRVAHDADIRPIRCSRSSAAAEAYIRPQRRRADLVIRSCPGDRGDQEHLDAKVKMRPSLCTRICRPW